VSQPTRKAPVQDLDDGSDLPFWFRMGIMVKH
jgi:hypothetical protein